MTTNTQIMAGVTSTASSPCFSGPSPRLCFMYLLRGTDRSCRRPAGAQLRGRAGGERGRGGRQVLGGQPPPHPRVPRPAAEPAPAPGVTESRVCGQGVPDPAHGPSQPAPGSPVHTRPGHSLLHVPGPRPVAPKGDGADGRDEDDHHVIVQHGLVGRIQRRPHCAAKALPGGRTAQARPRPPARCPPPGGGGRPARSTPWELPEVPTKAACPDSPA